MFKFLKRFFIVIFVLFLFMVIINISPWTYGKVSGENRWRSDKPLVIPHGGAKALYPENTKYAFDNTTGYDVYEVDLALTKDGVLISHHDLNFRYSFDQSKPKAVISELTYDQVVDKFREEYYLAKNFTNINGIKEYASWTDEQLVDFVPMKLIDILTTFSDKFFILEIKDTPEKYDGDDQMFKKASDELLRLIDVTNMKEKVLVGSFSDDVISYFKNEDSSIYTGAATKEVTNFSIFSAFYIDFFYKTKSEVLILPNGEETIGGGTAKILNLLPGFIRNSIAKKIDGTYHANLMHKQLINDAHRKNMAVIYWTVNEEDEMRMLIELGVDGIITDRPDLLIEVLKEYYPE